ncbi:MAG: sulfite exporter TauE/SafE family protein [Paracoccaceae bacterium]|nr:sulfite exporter TauE/SafE family protein [Paracoccaceae bacterium]
MVFWVLATLSAIFVGLGKGGLPVIALLAVPVLSLVMPTIAAASLLLPVYIVSDLFALFAYRRDFSKDVLKIGVIGMTIGVAVGWMTAHVVIDWIVTLFIGFMGATFSLNLLIKQMNQKVDIRPLSYKRGYFWCLVAGFTSFISHSGGPPWQIFTLPLNLSKSVFVGTSVIAFSYCNVIKLVPYYFLGQIDSNSFKTTIYLTVPASIAVFIGVKIVKLIPEKMFYKFVSFALLFISTKLIWDGFTASEMLNHVHIF